MAGLVRNFRRLQHFSTRFRIRTLSHDHAEQASNEEIKKEHVNHTHFGFETVTEEEKERKVYKVFENVSEKYDLMNDAMSAGVHRLWKDYFISRMKPLPGTKLLDVAGGTGDIAFRFLEYANTSDQSDPSRTSDSDFDFDLPNDIKSQLHIDTPDEKEEEASMSSGYEESEEEEATHATVCDVNQSMLDVGKRRAEMMGIHEGLSWVCANAESLPMPDDEFDVYTIAFGIRNCTHVDKVLDEAYRVLKPGGRFMCLEFSHVPNPLIRSMYDLYSFQVIPVMGQVLAADWKSYQYLVESIRKFPKQEEFSKMIEDAGFCSVRHENLSFGVAAIHSGFKL